MENQKYMKVSLIERTGLTFSSFLEREFADRFYREDFLREISARRAEVYTQMTKLLSIAFTTASILAFFDIISGDISYNGVKIRITRDIMPIIALISASALLGSILKLIDEQIILRILMKIGLKIDILNFPLLLVEKYANNLWADALTPRFFGPKSGRFQFITFIIIIIVTIIAALAFFIYPAGMICKVVFDTMWSDARYAGKLAAALSGILLFCSVYFVIVFLIRFPFAEADWRESTRDPTDEFARKMRDKISASEDRKTQA
jgi:hypothetical protein